LAERWAIATATGANSAVVALSDMNCVTTSTTARMTKKAADPSQEPMP
jgi:hypothetical protein